ncbi:MAG: AI-2E family transporter [Patescibacteria group bacterium]
MKRNIVYNEVSWRTLGRIALFIGAAALIYYVTNLLLLIFLTYVLAAGLNPIINKISKLFNIPRILSVLSVVGLLVLFLGGVLFLSLQNIVSQTLELLDNLPDLLNNIIGELGLQNQFSANEGENIADQLERILGANNPFTNFGAQAISFTTNIFTGALTLITLAAITFYQLSDPGKVKKFLVSFADIDHQEHTLKVINKVEDKLGHWLIGQFGLMTVVGILTYTGLKIIGIEYALPLALISGITDIIPVIGPVVAIVPIIIVALATASLPQALVVLAFMIILQQIEGNILVPNIMNKSVGLDPIVVILGIMLGSQLSGILGALLAVPIAVIINILFQEWQSHRIRRYEKASKET